MMQRSEERRGSWLQMCREVGESEGAEERSRRKVGVAVQRQDVILIEAMGNRGNTEAGGRVVRGVAEE